jgi:hypothetical protein
VNGLIPPVELLDNNYGRIYLYRTLFPFGSTLAWILVLLNRFLDIKQFFKIIFLWAKGFAFLGPPCPEAAAHRLSILLGKGLAGERWKDGLYLGAHPFFCKKWVGRPTHSYWQRLLQVTTRFTDES